MDLGDGGGISPRKKMAMGKDGKIGCEPLPVKAAQHPDAMARTGDKGAMGEGERAVSAGIARGGANPGMQANPNHGPLHHSNVAFRR